MSTGTGQGLMRSNHLENPGLHGRNDRGTLKFVTMFQKGFKAVSAH